MKVSAATGRGVLCVILLAVLAPIQIFAKETGPGQWIQVDSVVATIDGSPILKTDILMEADLGLLKAPDGGDDFSGLMETYLNRSLILKEVEEVGGFRLTQGQSEGAYRGFLLRYHSRQDYLSKLKSWGLSEKDVRKMLNRALLASLYTESHLQFFVNILPSDIEKAYSEDPGRWGGESVYEAWETIKSELRQTTYQSEKARWLSTLRERYNLVIFGKNGE